MLSIIEFHSKIEEILGLTKHGISFCRSCGLKKTVFGFILTIAFLFFGYTPIATATEIVVNKTVSASDLSEADIRAIFTMKKTAWPNRRPIKVYTPVR